MRRARLGLFITSFILSGCVVRLSILQAPLKTTLSADRVELATTFVDRRPCVDLKINGKGPYRFIVDTGSITTNISERIARESGIVVSRKIIARVSGTTGKYENQPTAIIGRLESEGFFMKGLAVVVWQSVSAWGDGVDGLIGMAALQDVILEIDYPKQKVSLFRSENVSLPVSDGISYSGLRPQVTVSTPSSENRKIEVVIDTGADEGFALNNIYSFPTSGGLSKEDRYATDVGGEFSRPLFGQLSGDMSFGPARWRNPLIRESENNRIGSPALEHWKLVIDQKKKMLWLLGEKGMMTLTTYDGPLESDGRPAVSGFAGVADGDAVLVKEVDPNSRADRAGLKIGDRILMETIVPVVAGASRDRAEKVMRLKVVRGSEKIEISLSFLDAIFPEIGTPQSSPSPDPVAVDVGSRGEIQVMERGTPAKKEEQPMEGLPAKGS